MKTASEVAEGIMMEYEQYASKTWLRNAIAQALTEYADERVKEALDRDDRAVFEGGKTEARAEALEEVRRDIGKMLDTFPLDPKIAAIAQRKTENGNQGGLVKTPERAVHETLRDGADSENGHKEHGERPAAGLDE